MPDDSFTTYGVAAGDKEKLNANGHASVYSFTDLNAKISILLSEQRKLSPFPVGDPSSQGSGYQGSPLFPVLKKLHRGEHLGDFAFVVDFEKTTVKKVWKRGNVTVAIYNYAAKTMLKEIGLDFDKDIGPDFDGDASYWDTQFDFEIT
ncbi:MAG: hypothetical protein LBF58_12185 [Deltaproteobacteria bacterium]|jgi:hypothetical protein|nr:hypothetical protein [Deltaproteobacteria bacterium]